MACPNPFDALRVATESLGDDLYVEASHRSIALNLIPREVYPMGTGLTQSVFTIGRSEPTTDEPEFERITLTTGETHTGACGTTYNQVDVGFNEDTYSPEQFGWKGPLICQDDLIYSFKAAAFWGKYIPAMAKHTEKTISNRLFAIYDHYVPKVVASSDMETTDPGTGHPGTSPDLTLDHTECNLDQLHLDRIAAELNEEGAFQPNSNGWLTMGPDGPIYPLYIGQEESARLSLVNAEFRDDTRYAFSGKGNDSPLFQRIGATRVIKNFRHVINLFPPRYDYTDGAYVRVPTWQMVDGTKGKVARINPAWRTAAFEGARVLSPWVFHSQIIKPVNSVPGASWSPKNYMGEWNFVRGGYKFDSTCSDPQEKLGKHLAEFKHAPKPIFPKYGRLIIFRRCPNGDIPCNSCS